MSLTELEGLPSVRADATSGLALCFDEALRGDLEGEFSWLGERTLRHEIGDIALLESSVGLPGLLMGEDDRDPARWKKLSVFFMYQGSDSDMSRTDLRPNGQNLTCDEDMPKVFTPRLLAKFCRNAHKYAHTRTHAYKELCMPHGDLLVPVLDRNRGDIALHRD